MYELYFTKKKKKKKLLNNRIINSNPNFNFYLSPIARKIAFNFIYKTPYMCI